MKRLEFPRDGCDVVMHAALPSGGKPDLALEGWVAHHVVMQENGSTTYQNSADLCPDCAEKMRHAVNPANWPRMSPTLRQFAKKPAR
jgi:hypothetical protein